MPYTDYIANTVTFRVMVEGFMVVVLSSMEYFGEIPLQSIAFLSTRLLVSLQLGICFFSLFFTPE